MTVVPQSGGAVAGGGSGNLYDVLELILDRGLVIDAFVRVSLVGIEIAKIDVRVVVASVDTYLRFAEACNRLDLEAGRKAPAELSDIVDQTSKSGARGKSKGALEGAAEAITDTLQGGREREREKEPVRREHSRQEHGKPKRSARRSKDEGDEGDEEE